MSKKRKTFYFDKTVDVEVEIDIDDLEDAGYHHEDDCPHGRESLPGAPDLSGALASLHRQAHPNAHPEVFLCMDEPCRSLDMSLIGYFGPRVAASSMRPTETVELPS